MNYGNIKYCDIANGEGVRTTLFVSGCTHHCKGCFQPETWDFDFGTTFDEAAENAILDSLTPDYIDGITVLGGEPMEPANQRALEPFLRKVRERFPNKNVWVYTGDVFESLIDEASARHTEVTDKLLEHIDVLVDGPFVEELKDISARFRGSSNQRIIDVPASLEAGNTVLWQDANKEFATRGEW
ncbi:MAG: anaerobic ribonucleoside-triphosphate reductase activating protein [Eggerthellaceae bacterium]|nr:anaerobic ribonucleoside-triphosphate reductase activating protein [Eggerthellaceae bacterium]